MDLSPLAKVLIIMNNYFHDVATAMLFSSAIIMWLLGRKAAADGAAAARWFSGSYRTLTRVAQFSIVWIVLGGIPRTIWFEQVEWNMADPSNKYLFTALMIKHAFMWVLVFVGVVLWARMRKLIAGATIAQPSPGQTSEESGS